jgi:hypothetical protein
MADREEPWETPEDRDGRFLEQALLGLDGLLGEEAQAALKGRLADEVESRRLFVQVCLLSQALIEGFGLPRRDVLPPERADPEASGPRLAEVWDEVGPSRKPGGLEPHRRPPRWARRAWVPWMVAAAACVVLLLTHRPAAWRPPAIEPPPTPATKAPAQEVQHPPGGARRDVAPPEAVAMMIKLDDALWEP